MRSIDRIIEDAIKGGEFDNLAGKGKPLNLDENPYIDREWQLAYHLLKQNGFALQFIEQRQAIEVELASAREALARSWAWRGRALAAGQQSDWVEGEWDKARESFAGIVEKLNAHVKSYNLTIPSPQLHRKTIDVKVEIDRTQKN
jgi:DnaJ family protein C protein 28